MNKILIAEDNAVNRELLRELLEMRGYAVVEACDGEEALRMIEQAQPDLLLLDIGMPEVIADTTDDPPSVRLKLHWAGGSHTELTVSKNRTGYHNHINSQEVTELIRELALVCEDTSIVSILNRLGYRTGNGNTWTEKRVQHVRHTNGFSACPSPDQRLWITMQQAAATLRVSEMVVRRLIAQKSLPAKQIVKFAPWMIERSHLDLPSVRKEIRRVHEGRRRGWAVSEEQTGLFADS